MCLGKLGDCPPRSGVDSFAAAFYRRANDFRGRLRINTATVNRSPRGLTGDWESQDFCECTVTDSVLFDSPCEASQQPIKLGLDITLR